MGSPARSECVVDQTLVEDALDLVNINRFVDYGDPRENLSRTATLWSAALGTPVDASQVALCMTLMKISRQSHEPLRDNIVDAIAYLMIADSLSR